MFPIIGRVELFTENFFDPAATAFERRASGVGRKILRLWSVTFLLNLVGGAGLVTLSHIAQAKGADESCG